MMTNTKRKQRFQASLSPQAITKHISCNNFIRIKFQFQIYNTNLPQQYGQRNKTITIQMLHRLNTSFHKSAHTKERNKMPKHKNFNLILNCANYVSKSILSSPYRIALNQQKSKQPSNNPHV